MKVLITGGSSLLGRYLHQTKPDGVVLASTWHTNHVPGTNHQLDITNPQQVRHVFGIVKPDVVIHCAANGSVDYAERNFTEAHMVNVIGTRHITEAATDSEAKLVYISSNAVYDGEHPPYLAECPQRPINRYGQLKQLAENEAKYNFAPLIIRPFLLYGWPHSGGRGNWAVMVIDALRQGKPVKMVNDHIWMPTYAHDAAAAIWQLLDRENEAFNIAAPERVTLYEFAVKVAEVWGLDSSLIEPVSSDYFPNIAPRPHDTTYDLTKARLAGVMMDCIEAGLKRMKGER